MSIIGEIWRDANHVYPCISFVVELPAFEKAISFNYFRLRPLLRIVEFDVPAELRAAFLQVGRSKLVEALLRIHKLSVVCLILKTWLVSIV
jgi:hypothetical protein